MSFTACMRLLYVQYYYIVTTFSAKWQLQNTQRKHTNFHLLSIQPVLCTQCQEKEFRMAEPALCLPYSESTKGRK